MFEVVKIDKGSAGGAAGIKKGDKVLSFNGIAVEDVLDCEFFDGEQNFTIEILKKNGKRVTLKIVKQAHRSLGLTFDADTYLKPKTCCNKCLFCFIDQLPVGMRQALYFKDDDWRLSFVSGNYVTLTNLGKNDIERICTKKFSPLYVSVHATNDSVRREMLQRQTATEIMPLLRKLTDSAIELHAQIVLCPGINDGVVLQNSLKDLFMLYPKLNSVAVVPVGLTKHREGLAYIDPVSNEKAQEVIAIVEKFAADAKEKTGEAFVWCSDEFYIKAEMPLPNHDYYGNFPQIENGIGLHAKFEAEFREALSMAAEAKRGGFSVITGTAAAGFMQKMVRLAKEKFSALDCNVIAVKNEFFGDTVTVS